MPTRVTAEQITELAAIQDEAASRALEAVEQALDDAEAIAAPAECRDFLIARMSRIYAEYGNLAASSAAQWYQGVRGNGDGYRALPTHAADRSGAVEESVRWAVGALWGDDAVSGIELAWSRIRGILDRNVRQAGQDSLQRCATRDGSARGFVIAPVGPTCAWCTMLASRTDGYTTADAAARSVHAGCDCQIVPDFGSGVESPWRDLCAAMYKAAAKEAARTGRKDIDAILREQNPTLLTDGASPAGEHKKTRTAFKEEKRFLNMRDETDDDMLSWDRRQTLLGIPVGVDVLECHEIVSMERFAASGNHMEWIPKKENTPTNDFYWVEEREEVELKGVSKSKYATIADQIRKASVNAADKSRHDVTLKKDFFIVDIGDLPLSKKLRTKLAKYNRNNRNTPNATIRKLWILSGRDVIPIELE